jgi:hypothetical protein
MWLLVNEAANAAGDPEFTGRARSYFMWMAIIALVVMWIWLYLRVKKRPNPPQPPQPPQPPAPTD